MSCNVWAGHDVIAAALGWQLSLPFQLPWPSLYRGVTNRNFRLQSGDFRPDIEEGAAVDFSVNFLAFDRFLQALFEPVGDT